MNIEWSKLFSIIFATFISEDITCISSGILAHTSKLNIFTAVIGCTVGVFIGDMILFFIGRLGKMSLYLSPKIREAIEKKSREYVHRIHKEGWKLVVLARFIPGLRVPVYITFGFIETKVHTMLFFVLIAGLIWTPSLVLLAYYIGSPFKDFIEHYLIQSWKTSLILLFCLYLSLKVIYILSKKERLLEFYIKVKKIFLIEFWPRSAFYFPVLPWFLFWLFRYRGPQIITATNPCFLPYGSDVVGESKANILNLLPKKFILDYYLIPKINSFEKFKKECLKKRAWKYPIVFKPDQGQRGRGVKIIHNDSEAHIYFNKSKVPILAQKYHPGPFELGVFYFRYPDEKSGNIFSITEKVFPKIKGDGLHTIENLIWKNPRLQIQAPLFLKRIKEKGVNVKKILHKNETLSLGEVGNHSQGTLFLDGSRYNSKKLSQCFDSITKSISGGFYFGRFDVRFADERKLKEGKEFKIIELNGVTSESTNLYDPKYNFFQKYQIIIRQWKTLLKIADKNYKKNPMNALGFIDFLKLIYNYKKLDHITFISD